MSYSKYKNQRPPSRTEANRNRFRIGVYNDDLQKYPRSRQLNQREYFYEVFTGDIDMMDRDAPTSVELENYSKTHEEDAIAISDMIFQDTLSNPYILYDGTTSIGGNFMQFLNDYVRNVYGEKTITGLFGSELNRSRFEKLVRHIESEYESDLKLNDADYESHGVVSFESPLGDKLVYLHQASFNDVYTDLIQRHAHKRMVFFLDPPWGGRGYKRYDYIVFGLGKESFVDIIRKMKRLTHNTIHLYIKVPSNYFVEEFRFHGIPFEVREGFQQTAFHGFRVIYIKVDGEAETEHLSLEDNIPEELLAEDTRSVETQRQDDGKKADTTSVLALPLFDMELRRDPTQRHIHKYREVIVGDGNLHQVHFELHNIPLAVANGLRRAMGSDIPTVLFDDTYVEDLQHRSIVIDENTSALHNEFLAHRLSLVPIGMEKTREWLRISSSFDRQGTGKRQYTFVDPRRVPRFEIRKQNTVDVASERNTQGILDVSTDDIRVWVKDETETDIELDNRLFFRHDPFTGEPILINKLKRRVMDETQGESMTVVCRPHIATGKHHARHDPTGTVSFAYKQDPTQMEQAFQDRIALMEQERAKQRKPRYSEKELKRVRKSFDILDSQRVYERNDRGEPTAFLFSVEGIGSLYPHQIVFDGLYSMMAMVHDVVSSFYLRLSEDKGGVIRWNVETHPKVRVYETEDMQKSCLVDVSFETHTFGNMMVSYLRSRYMDAKSWFSYIAYKKAHPLMDEITFQFVPRRGGLKSLREEVASYLEQRASRFAEMAETGEWKDDRKSQKEPLRGSDVRHAVESLEEYAVYRLAMAISWMDCSWGIIDDIRMLLEEWKALTGLEEVSWVDTSRTPEWFRNFVRPL